MTANPKFKSALHGFKRRSRQLLIGQHTNHRFQHMITCGNSSNRFAKPTQSSIRCEHERRIDSFADTRGACFDLAGQPLHRGGIQGFLRFAFRLRVWRETKAVQLTDMLPLDYDFARGRYFGFQHCILS